MIIALVGSNGRMGKTIKAVAEERNHVVIPIDINTTNTDMIKCDSIIDFSSDKALDQTISIATRNNCPLVLGVTTYSKQQLQHISDLSSQLPISLSSNYSIGINALEEILPQLLGCLDSWQCSITETHHHTKIDSPSGTALSLKKIVESSSHTCPITSVRNGDTIGKHTITLTGEDEIIEITHTANSRKIFALGAVISAEKLFKQNKHQYN